MSTLRDHILSKQDIPSQIVEIAQWGVKIEIRGMTGAARAEMVQEASASDGSVNYAQIMPDLVIRSCYDPETGEPIFAAEDRDILMTKSGAALEHINKVAMALSGFSADGVDAAGKGSSSTPSGGSSSN